MKAPSTSPIFLTVYLAAWALLATSAYAAPGDVDVGFDTKPDRTVDATVAQPDGKTVIGGDFSLVGVSARNSIARLNADGSLDAAFDPNVNNSVFCLAVQIDGKILLGGDFTTVGGTAHNYLARLNADGSLDPGFNPNVNNGYVDCIVVQTDGKIVIGGSFLTVGGTIHWRVARLQADGLLDTTFNPNANREVSSIALQTDGKIVVGGSFGTVSPMSQYGVTRLQADGSLDATFTPALGGGVESIAVQADGKILLGGALNGPGGSFTIARLNADGSLDSAFNPGADKTVRSIAIQANGKILLGGFFNTVGGTTRNYVARVNADGSLDTGFNPNANFYVHSVAVEANGTILLGGPFATVGSLPRGYVARLFNDAAEQTLTLPDATQALWNRGSGAPEVSQVTFESSTDGGANWTQLGAGTRIGTSANWQSTGLALPASGTLRVRGRTVGGKYNGSSGLIEQVAAFSFIPVAPTVTLAAASNIVFTTASLNGTASPNGLATTAQFDYGLDTNYGSTATVTLSPPDGTSSQPVSAALDGLQPGQTYHYRLTATNSMGMAGTVDGSFTTNLPPPNVTTGAPMAIAARAVTFSGSVNPNGLTTTAQFQYGDTTAYGNTVSLTLSPGNGTNVQSVTTTQSGLLPSTTYHCRLKASNANGTTNGADQTFTTPDAPAIAGDLEMAYDPNIGSGVLDTTVRRVFSTAAQPDGKMIVGGFFTTVGGAARNMIARLNGDGSLDTPFDPNANSDVSCVGVQTDGKIVLGGVFTTIGSVTRNRLARVNADGSLDTGFNPNVGGNGFTEVESVAIQADGKILFGGNFTTVGGVTRNRLARVNANGSLDTGFNANVSAVAGSVHSLAVQTDGKILLGGVLERVGGTSRNCIARVNANGSLDTAFNPIILSGTTTEIDSLAVQADGKILLGGNFTTVGGTTRNRIARLNANGSLDTGFNPNANGNVYGLAVQADGKILLAGNFTTVGGATRRSLARVNANGSLDMGFNPNANSTVNGVTVQADGKILPGGFFTTIGGTTHRYLARLLNDTATQTLATPDSAQVLWSRSGAASEVEQVSFELSTDGAASWSPLGAGTRVGSSADWQLTGIALPASGQVRARGRAAGGRYNGSSGLIEQVTVFTVSSPYQQWKLTHLGNASAPDLGDTDGDGLATLAEYGLNLLPETPSQAPGTMVFTYAEGDRLRMIVPRDPAHNDITVNIEATGDLVSGPWIILASSTLGASFTGPGYVGGDSMTPGVKTVEVRDIVNFSATAQRWLRVKVTH